MLKEVGPSPNFIKEGGWSPRRVICSKAIKLLNWEDRYVAKKARRREKELKTFIREKKEPVQKELYDAFLPILRQGLCCRDEVWALAADNNGGLDKEQEHMLMATHQPDYSLGDTTALSGVIKMYVEVYNKLQPLLQKSDDKSRDLVTQWLSELWELKKLYDKLPHVPLRYQ